MPYTFDAYQDLGEFCRCTECRQRLQHQRPLYGAMTHVRLSSIIPTLKNAQIYPEVQTKDRANLQSDMDAFKQSFLINDQQDRTRNISFPQFTV